MTWDEALRMMQLEAEERIGAPLRNAARAERAREDAVFESLAAGLVN